MVRMVRKNLTISFFLLLLSISIAAMAQAQLSLDSSNKTYNINFDDTVDGVNNGQFDAGATGNYFSPTPGENTIDSDAFFVFEFIGNAGMSGVETDQGGTMTGGLRGINYTTANNNNPQGIHANLDANGGSSRAFIVQGGSYTYFYQLALHLKNTSGDVIDKLTVSYDIRARAAGAGDVSAKFYHNSIQPTVAAGAVQDGINGWAQAGSAVTEYGQNDPSLPWSDKVTETATLEGLNLSDGDSYYLVWEFTVHNGNSTQRGALALDNITVSTAGPAEPPVETETVFTVDQIDTPHLIDFDSYVEGATNYAFNAGSTGNGFSPEPGGNGLDSSTFYVFHFVGNSGMASIAIDQNGSTTGGLRGINYDTTHNLNFQGIHANLDSVPNSSRAFIAQGGSYTLEYQLAMRIKNNTGRTITSLEVDYDAYTRAAGSGTATLNVLHNSSQPTVAGGKVQDGVYGWKKLDQVTQAGQNNPALPWSENPRSLSITDISIPDGSDYYVVFDFDLPNGESEHRGALAIDNISVTPRAEGWAGSRPNILVLVTDDHSYPHLSAMGANAWVDTPNFDRLAENGVLFTNGYVPTPSCSPTRASILTGLYPWQLDEGMRHASELDDRFRLNSYPRILETSGGYFGGFITKGWGPGENWDDDLDNPAGFRRYHENFFEASLSSSNDFDYTREFIDLFMAERPEGAPFCMWVGLIEPHRPYVEHDDGIAGRDPNDVVRPGFVADTSQNVEDLMKYAEEIEWADEHAGRIIDYLESIGELDNTLIVMIGDNGMDFLMRAKTTIYDFGVHVPFIVHWSGLPSEYRGRVVDDVVNGVDLTSTFYEVAGVEPPFPLTGRSLLPLLTTSAEGQVDLTRDYTIFGTERHTTSGERPGRAIRKGNYLYQRNWDRETAENPGQTEPEFGQRLFDLSVDPYCLQNIYYLNLTNRAIGDALWATLQSDLLKHRDPRMFGMGAAFQGAAEYSNSGFTPEDPTMLDYVETLMDQDNDNDGFEDAVSIHFGFGPDGINDNSTIPPTLAKSGSDFAIQYHRSIHDHFFQLVIEYSFDAGATWSSENLSPPEVIGVDENLEVVQVTFPDQGFADAEVRFSANRRFD